MKLLDNPKRIQAAALNLGLRKAKGDIIIRMDAHTLYASDYISQCVNLLTKTEAANVGGPQQAVGNNYITKAIALAVSTPFGAGDARFRHVNFNKEAWVETVYLGAWFKKTLEEIGGFNEEWVINEDFELNYRLRQKGYRILLSPKIRSQYFVRSSIGKLARQYFRYGFWKVKTLNKHPSSLRWRQLVPPAFALGLLLSLAIFPFSATLGAIVPLVYLGSNFLASFITSRKNNWQYLPILPIVYAVIHISWGSGFLIGLIKFGVPRLSIGAFRTAFAPIDSRRKAE